MSYKKDRGVTLTEILIVVIIIAILVILSMPRYTETRERGLAREAVATLKLISVAEKIYHIKLSTYWPNLGSNTDKGEIGGALKLNLTEMNWDYAIVGGVSTFNVTANTTRTTGAYPSCQYSVNHNYTLDTDVPKSGCP